MLTPKGRSVKDLILSILAFTSAMRSVWGTMGGRPFMRSRGVVGGDAHNEAVAPGGCGVEDVEMPDVEHIEATGYVAGEHQ